MNIIERVLNPHDRIKEICKKYFYAIIAAWNLFSILAGNIVIYETTNTENKRYCVFKLFCSWYTLAAVIFVILVAYVSFIKDKTIESERINDSIGTENETSGPPEDAEFVNAHDVLERPKNGLEGQKEDGEVVGNGKE